MTLIKCQSCELAISKNSKEMPAGIFRRRMHYVRLGHLGLELNVSEQSPKMGVYLIASSH